METMKYELKFIPGKSVDVPKYCGEDARRLVNFISKNPERLAEVLHEPYFGSVGISNKTTALINDPDSPKLQDQLYLLICIKCNEKRLFDPNCEDMEEVREIDINLNDAYNMLYYKRS